MLTSPEAHDPIPTRSASPFSAERILELSRALTAVIDDEGLVLDARGGFGRFLGWEVDDFIGRPVFDFVPSGEVERLITYFIENDGVAAEAIALTAPFRVSILDPVGLSHAVDVIPTGVPSPDGSRTIWVIVLVPVALFGSITRSLDLEMSGADRGEVSRMLCEELAIDDVGYTTRWVLVDLRSGSDNDCITSRDDDRDVAEAVHADVVAGWAPWRGLDVGEVRLVPPAQTGPATLDTLGARGWQRVIVAPIHLENQLVAAFLQVGRVPESYVSTPLKSNVAERIGRLVSATTLLMRRWNDQEQLRRDATYDALTGLHNARSLRRELESRRASGSMLFVDVDHFKPVNDTYGHAVGDRVLELVAARIVESCRDGDFVARVGGDEFAILLEGVTPDTATEIGERIIETVALPLQIDNGPERVTVSVGQASLDSGNAFEAADQAMLLAKRSGRSRVAIADDS
ncbi:MAG: diguanylate cyclase [Ilumatobacter sp.]